MALNRITTNSITVSGVTTGNYGSESNGVPVITLGTDGRVTYAANVAISGIDAHPFVFTALGT
jgi:hypothetical protein